MAHDTSKKGMGSFGAAILGAAIGAGAVALSNKDTREKLKGKYNQLRQTGEEKIGEAREKVEQLGSEGKRKVSEVLGKAEDTLNDANDKAQKTVYKSKRRMNEV